MNTNVDVLAVMDKANFALSAKGVDLLADHLSLASAAVAELINASNEMLRVERTQGVTEAEFEAAVEALDAALTRVQGGAS